MGVRYRLSLGLSQRGFPKQLETSIYGYFHDKRRFNIGRSNCTGGRYSLAAAG
jgi:hypothetical protein